MYTFNYSSYTNYLLVVTTATNYSPFQHQQRFVQLLKIRRKTTKDGETGTTDKQMAKVGESRSKYMRQRAMKDFGRLF